ncbi:MULTISPECIES: trypsin-like peptidase domain-containing protein [Leptolyngbya]|nr:trypsin-like peptidase domain-containing protein [Leptolyngbya boryana]MBD2368404.1 trypsin-like peptidase domain-containing protein [Leptolyngbya sp. FACHB-161]MBD2374940.1 trypsin-like peptidase domain-containing protein [Leptolyngbya sp. FACHB-238]MBD2399360.1 trypsin-like peptidase domain-containing protein [Leptolyngbya sp. FACHB-239]MBD2405565.1 trypsin-like peptidase domain-containing protein [Leptolyngbya sp. FACHB-402]ULP32343.1 serine protease [Leptolyngbya boryana IU 594]
MDISKQRFPELRDAFSHVPFQISMCFKDTKIAIGTAFFYLYEGKPYLVTNWHNVTGREPDTLKCKSSQAGIPDRLHIKIPYSTQHESGAKLMQWRTQIMPLYEDEGDAPSKPVWYEHPRYRHKVDLVVIPVNGIEETESRAANDPNLEFDNIRLRPGLDVFVLGFPRGIGGGANFPIWKRASIASEPDFDIDGLPKILIDTATREGMSGSPVYAQQIGYWLTEGATNQNEAVIGEGRRFLGIYSGRLGDDHYKAQLGIVWKPSAIDETIQAATIGISSFHI